MLEILSWIFLGLVVGVLAKWIMPGKDPGGFWLTVAIGIAGALIGGFIARALGIDAVAGFSLKGLAVAVGGALLLLFAHRAFAAKK